MSPIVGGAPVKGPADRLMGPLGIEVSCVGVARTYREFCGTLVIDAVDAHLASEVEAAGVRAVVTDTMMRSPEVAADAGAADARGRRVTSDLVAADHRDRRHRRDPAGRRDRGR